MKFVFTFVLLMSFQTAFAKPLLFSKVERYINIKTYAMVELSEFDMNEDGTATFYSYAERKKLTVNLDDLAKETTKEIAGVKSGELVLIESGKGLILCEAYSVFENGSARIACRTGKITKNIGVDRLSTSSHTLLTVDQAGVVAEVDSIEGLVKKDRVYLKVETVQIEKGSEVKVIAVFANGDVAIERVGLGILDTSGPIMKKGVIIVNISQLDVKNENQ